MSTTGSKHLGSAFMSCSCKFFSNWRLAATNNLSPTLESLLHLRFLVAVKSCFVCLVLANFRSAVAAGSHSSCRLCRICHSRFCNPGGIQNCLTFLGFFSNRCSSRQLCPWSIHVSTTSRRMKITLWRARREPASGFQVHLHVEECKNQHSFLRHDSCVLVFSLLITVSPVWTWLADVV